MPPSRDAQQVVALKVLLAARQRVVALPWCLLLLCRASSARGRCQECGSSPLTLTRACCDAVYGVSPAKQTWLPAAEVAETLGLDGPQQVQELAEAYGMTVGTMPDGGTEGLLIPAKVCLQSVSGMGVLLWQGLMAERSADQESAHKRLRCQCAVQSLGSDAHAARNAHRPETWHPGQIAVASSLTEWCQLTRATTLWCPPVPNTTMCAERLGAAGGAAGQAPLRFHQRQGGGQHG